MTCNHIRGLLEQRLDGPLSARESRSVEMHLAGCDECRRYAAGLETLTATLAGMPLPHHDPAAAREILRGAAARLEAARTLFPRRAVAIAAGVVLVFIVGYLAGRGRGPTSSAVRVVEMSAGNVCAALAGYAYELDPGMIYRAGARGLVMFRAGAFTIDLPASLGSHGPYSLRDERAGGSGHRLCAPYVSPFGEVLVLHLDFAARGRRGTGFEVFSDEARIMHHGVTWWHGENRFMLEGRVPASYLLDMAMELQGSVTAAPDSSESHA
ncbi:zf-HC2 domain-containing protein [bacterium]|nr:zf-HC2 domain-containing protein [candidate division CSSED10-310 bacterium]